MDILVTIDRNYLRPLSVMLKSLAIHHRNRSVPGLHSAPFPAA